MVDAVFDTPETHAILSRVTKMKLLRERVLSRLKSLREIAVVNYQPKIIDPALMTFDEYIKMVNPQNKFHPSDAYKTDGDSLEYMHKEDYKDLINRKTINGIVFEFRIRKEYPKYVKTLPDGGIVRGTDGLALYWTTEELKELGYPTEVQTFAVFKGEDAVGMAADEWGALLVQVVPKYQGFGLGAILQKIARKYKPDWDSGGFTSHGYKLSQRTYRDWVKEYLANGVYSHLIKNGTLTKERVKAILDSAKLSGYKKPVKIDLSFSNNKNWLVYHEANDSTFAVYDRTLKDIIEVDKYEDFLENAIKGYGFAREGNYDQYYFYILFADDSKTYKLLAEMIIADSSDKDFYLREDEYERLKNHPNFVFGGVKTPKQDGFVKSVRLKKKVSHNFLFKAEQAFRREFDRYDEFKARMLEIAESKGYDE